MIYLDNAATTQPFMFENNEHFYANPSSPHQLGIAAERSMQKARQELCNILHCKLNELIFTAGGTESNNLMIIGYALAHMKKNKANQLANLLTIFAEPWAHPSVLAPIQYIIEQGMGTACIAPMQKWDIPKTGAVLVCLSHVNHETGDMTNIVSTSQNIKKENPAAIIFTDGAQGFCKDIHQAEAVKFSDAYSFSGHKFHAPTGIGCLMVREGVSLAPLFYGGGQENGLRAGTENVNAMLHIAQTATYLQASCEENSTFIAKLKDEFLKITHALTGVKINALTENVSPYIVNLSFLGTRGEVLVHMLSEKGVHVAMGAACKSRKKDKSILATMGFPREISESALRFSFSHKNTMDEIEKTKEILIACVQQVRKVNGYQD
jgi:cysteine desulfurase